MSRWRSRSLEEITFTLIVAASVFRRPSFIAISAYAILNLDLSPSERPRDNIAPPFGKLRMKKSRRIFIVCRHITISVREIAHGAYQ